jgi:hypothetical protein
MKRLGLVLAGLSVALVGVLLVPAAKADSTYDFSIDLTNGNVHGTLTGTLDLPFVSPGGTGSGAAGSLILTSIPAGFGTLAGGDVVSSWADQDTDDFTVTNGTITSFAFMAFTTGDVTVGDDFCINSLGGSAAGTSVTWTCPGRLNTLSVTAKIFGNNFGGLSGVTFTPTPAVSEPGTSTLTLISFGLLGLIMAMRKRNLRNRQLAN